MAERPVVQTPLDRYVVLEYLAEGGMGAIYLGKKLGAGGFEKEVVLKQLLPEFTRQPEFIDLFLREARLSATLDHANIVHTIDLVNAGEEYFIVMEYVRGGDLRTLLKRAKRRRKRLAPAAAMFIAREILSALAYAHQKVGTDGLPLSLIHRDVSPSNILISGNGEVKLTDFGIAKASTHRSIFYKVKGKVGYMSPEQARSDALDPRSDLYSVAVCLYEMLTGERLFVAPSLTTSAEELYSQPVPAISRKRMDLPRDMDKLMFTALSVDPAGRFQTAGEFQEALLRVAHRNGLMVGASEMARMAMDACGPVEEWSSPEVREIAREGREGTEAYAAGPGTEKIALSTLEEMERESTHTAALTPGEGAEGEGREEEASLSAAAVEDIDEISDLDAYMIEDDSVSADEWSRDVKMPADKGWQVHMIRRRPSTNAPRLTGLELTSLIRAEELTRAGAKPLVDLSDFGSENSELAPPPTPSTPEPAPSTAPRPSGAGLNPAGVSLRPSAPRPSAPRPSASSPSAPRPSAPRPSVPQPAAGARGVAATVARRSSPGMPSTERVPPVAERRPLILWLLPILMLFAGAGVAVVIAMSGPTLVPKDPTLRPRTPQQPEVSPSIGKLLMSSDPPGARVLVEKRERCTTPCPVDGLSTISPTVVRLELDGYLPWSGIVDLGRTPSRAATLRKRPSAGAKWGAVLIHANSPAEVLVDGKEIGHVTTEGPLELPAGSATLTLVAAGGARREEKVTVKVGETTALDVSIP